MPSVNGDTGGRTGADRLQANKNLAAQSTATSSSIADDKAAIPQLKADLDNGDYLGAWKLAEGTGNQANQYAMTGTNDLVQLMETPQGLNAIDPGKQWTQDDVTGYYKALTDPSVYNGGQLGQNPSGLWGDASHAASDATTDFTASGGAPDVTRYQGSRPDVSFSSRYGPAIGAIVGSLLVGPEVGAGVAAAGGSALASGVAAGASAGIASQLTSGSVANGNDPFKNVLVGGLTGALGGGVVPYAGAALNSATGIGSTAADALAGAGLGAAKGAITGQGAGVGALTGGISGAIQGSGIQQTAASALGGGALGSGIASALTGAAGTAAGNALLGKYGGSSTPASNGTITPTASSPAAASAPLTNPPAQQVGQQITAGQAATQPTAATGATPANIGAYGGYAPGLGYQPQTQVNSGIQNYATYGQGPQASFFANSDGSSPSGTPPSLTQFNETLTNPTTGYQ